MPPSLWDPHGIGEGPPIGVLRLRYKNELLKMEFAERTVKLPSSWYQDGIPTYTQPTGSYHSQSYSRNDAAGPSNPAARPSAEGAKEAKEMAARVHDSPANDADTKENTRPSTEANDEQSLGAIQDTATSDIVAPASNTSIHDLKLVLYSYGILIPLWIPKQGSEAEDERLKLESMKLLSYGEYIGKLVAGDHRWLPWLVKWGVLTKYKEVMMRDFTPYMIKLDLSDCTKHIAPLCVKPPEATWILHLGMWLTKLEAKDAQLGLMLKKWGVVDDCKKVMSRFYTPEVEQQKRKLVEARTTVALGMMLQEMAKEDSQRWDPLLKKWETVSNYKEATERHDVEMSLALSDEQKKAQEMTDDEVAVANANWPWNDLPPQLVLEAPLSLNRFNQPGPGFNGRGFFTLPNMNDAKLNVKCGREPGLFRIFNCNNILVQVCEYLFEYHSDVSNFSLTCQSAFKYLSGTVQHWDLSRSDFLNSDLDPGDASDLRKLIPADPLRQNPGKLIVASPFRMRKGLDKYGIGLDKYGMVTAERQVHSLQRMIFSMYKGRDCFEIIHLHRIPYLTFETLYHVIPYMRNLKVLGIYRCPLIHFGLILRLFRMMAKPHRIEVSKPPARLDFYPRYHVGPKAEAGEYSNGSFGVTWENSKLDTRLAIWCYVQKAMIIAKKIGIAEDCIVSPQSALYQWLEKICWNVGPTLQALLHDTYADDPEQLAALFDFPLTRGKKENLKYKFPYWKNSSWCGTCGEQVLNIFFTYLELANRERRTYISGPPLKCLGCKLAQHLANEDDHYQSFEKKVTDQWMVLQNAAGENFRNKTQTQLLFTNHKLEETLDCARTLIDGSDGARHGFAAHLKREGWTEYMQRPIEPFDQVAPRTTDGKDHISNPPKEEPGYWLP